MIKILALSGSSRRGSLNQKLLDQAALGARAAGAEVTSIRLADFELPIYDAASEAEHGLPKGAQTLNGLLAVHQGLLIATPEHNGGYTALLKNALDWMSRPNGFPSGKVAALISASPGPLGGVKSQLSLQIVLSKLGVHVHSRVVRARRRPSVLRRRGRFEGCQCRKGGSRGRRSTRGDDRQNWSRRPGQPRRVGP